MRLSSYSSDLKFISNILKPIQSINSTIKNVPLCKLPLNVTISNLTALRLVSNFYRYLFLQQNQLENQVYFDKPYLIVTYTRRCNSSTFIVRKFTSFYKKKALYILALSGAFNTFPALANNM